MPYVPCVPLNYKRCSSSITPPGLKLSNLNISRNSFSFDNSKNLNCIGALSFYDSKRSIGEVLFLKSILLEWFLKREMKHVKKFGVILVLNKSEEWSEKRVVFVHIAVFERAKNWCVKKFSLSERNFFVHVRHLKAVFATFDGYEVWLWYCIRFRPVMIWIEGFR